MSKYGIEVFENFEQKWKRNHIFDITKKTFSNKNNAEKSLSKYLKKIKQENKKADCDLRPNSYGGVQKYNFRIRKLR